MALFEQVYRLNLHLLGKAIIQVRIPAYRRQDVPRFSFKLRPRHAVDFSPEINFRFFIIECEQQLCFGKRKSLKPSLHHPLRVRELDGKPLDKARFGIGQNNAFLVLEEGAQHSVYDPGHRV